jgi:hypothetical protein
LLGCKCIYANVAAAPIIIAVSLRRVFTHPQKSKSRHLRERGCVLFGACKLHAHSLRLNNNNFCLIKTHARTREERVKLCERYAMYEYFGFWQLGARGSKLFSRAPCREMHFYLPPQGSNKKISFSALQSICNHVNFGQNLNTQRVLIWWRFVSYKSSKIVVCRET